jgi:hypothetical protein
MSHQITEKLNNPILFIFVWRQLGFVRLEKAQSRRKCGVLHSHAPTRAWAIFH